MKQDIRLESKVLINAQILSVVEYKDKMERGLYFSCLLLCFLALCLLTPNFLLLEQSMTNITTTRLEDQDNMDSLHGKN